MAREHVKVIDPGKFGVALSWGKLIAVIVGTFYFVVFVYQMRDAIKENIVANNVNQSISIAKQDENLKVQKQIVCLLRFQIYQAGGKYKGECEG